MKDTDSPVKVPVPFGLLAGGSFIRDVPIASQIGIEAGAASFETGYPPLAFLPVAGGGAGPFGQDENGLQFQITSWIRWLNAGGPVFYDGAFATNVRVAGYPKGAVLANASTVGRFWINTVDDNETDPDAGGAGWIGFSTTVVPEATTGSAHTYTAANVGTQALRSNSGAAMRDVLPGTSPGVLAVGDVISVTNSDASALLSVRAGTGAAISNEAFGYVVLGPGQSASFISDGSNYWTTQRPARAKFGAPTTLYCNPASGNNANDGLTTGSAFLTLQAMVNAVGKIYDFGGYVYTMKLLDGDYFAGMTVTGIQVGQAGVEGYVVSGNTTTPANVKIGDSSICVGAKSGAQILVEGVRVNSGGAGISAEDGGSSIRYRLMEFAACSAAHVGAGPYARIKGIGNYSISGDAVNHINAAAGQIQLNSGIVVTITNNPTFVFFAVGVEMGLIDSQAAFSGAAQGRRFGGNFNAVIYTAGAGLNYFPGNIAGSLSDMVAGAQYG